MSQHHQWRIRSSLRLDAKAGRRGVLGGAPRQPIREIAQSEQVLVGIAKGNNAALRQAIKPILEANGDAEVTPELVADLKKRVKASIKFDANGAAKVAVTNLGNLDKFNRSDVRRSIGVDVPEFSTAVGKKWMADHVSLIKTMGEKPKERFLELFETSAKKQVRVETLRSDLETQFGVNTRRARLIARDQILTLNAKLSEDRHKKVGITEYIWQTVQDGSVRSNHADLNGKRFKYAEPPMGGGTNEDERGNPGTGIGCRCQAIPVLPAADLPAALPAKTPRDLADELAVRRAAKKADLEADEIAVAGAAARAKLREAREELIAQGEGNLAKQKKIVAQAGAIEFAAELEADQWMGAKAKEFVKKNLEAFAYAYQQQFGKAPATLKQGKKLAAYMLNYGKAIKGADAFSEYAKTGKKLAPADLIKKAKPSEKHLHAAPEQIASIAETIDAETEAFYKAGNREKMAEYFEKKYAADPQSVAIHVGADAKWDEGEMLKAAKLLDAGDIKGAAKAFAKATITDEVIENAQKAAVKAKQEAIETAEKLGISKAINDGDEVEFQKLAAKMAEENLEQYKALVSLVLKGNEEIFDSLEKGAITWATKLHAKKIFTPEFKELVAKTKAKAAAAEAAAAAEKAKEKKPAAPKKTKAPKAEPAAEPEAPKLKEVDLPSAEGVEFKDVPGADKHIPGAAYVDMFDKSGKKLGFFFKKGDDYIVKPPPGLDVPEKKFKTPKEAAPHALLVKKLIEENAEALAKAQKELEEKQKLEALAKLKEQDKKRDEALAKQRKQFLGKGANPKVSDLEEYAIPAHSRNIASPPAVQTFDGSEAISLSEYKEKARAAAAKMPSADREAVIRFTGSAYSDIRKTETVRAGGKVELKPLGQRGPMSAKITSAIDAAQKYALKGQQVWRGISGVKRSQVEEWLREGKVQHYGTASTSRSKAVALRFGGMSEGSDGSLTGYSSGSDEVRVLYRLKNKTGVPVETISNFGSENEVMVKAGVEYKITNAYIGPKSGGSVIVIEAEEL